MCQRQRYDSTTEQGDIALRSSRDYGLEPKTLGESDLSAVRATYWPPTA